MKLPHGIRQPRSIGTPPAPAEAPETVREIVRLEQRERLTMTASDRLASRITSFTGSMTFVLLHAIWFGGWVIVNLGFLGLPAFAPFPFGLLTMIGSLEAIFLSTFVLISQNRQALQADQRAKVDLQVNLIAEQEVTKLLQMVAALHDKLGLPGSTDRDVRQMTRPTHVEEVATAIDAAEQLLEPASAHGPRSAADTDA